MGHKLSFDNQTLSCHFKYKQIVEFV